MGNRRHRRWGDVPADLNPTALEELGPFEFGPVNFSSLGLRVSFDQVIARSFVGLHANAHLGAPTSPQVELAAIFELSAVLSARLTALMPEARLRPVLIALDCQ